MSEKKKKNKILYISFNKDNTCLSLGMETGYRIYDLTKKDTLYYYERIFGKGIGIIEMLEKTNILGLVGGGIEPWENEKRVILYDDKVGNVIVNFGFKSKVLIKYNLFDLTKIKVYTPKGEYLCTAERVTETHPMAKLLGDVKDYEDYKQKIVRQRQLKKKTVESVKKYLQCEDIKLLEIQMEPAKIQLPFKTDSMNCTLKSGQLTNK